MAVIHNWLPPIVGSQGKTQAYQISRTLAERIQCIPVVERGRGQEYNKDLYVGYSSERINPGNKEYTVEKIRKVTSGSTPEIGKVVDEVYASVITAGTNLAPTIKVVEAAKLIEN